MMPHAVDVDGGRYLSLSLMVAWLEDYVDGLRRAEDLPVGYRAGAMDAVGRIQQELLVELALP